MNLINILFFKQVLLFLLFLLLFLSMGKLIIKKKISNSFFLDYFFYSILGISVLIIYISILSMFGFVNKITLLIPFLSLYGMRYFEYRKIPLLLLSIIFILFIPSIYLTLYPPTHWDDISYHLPIAQSILNNSGLIYNEYIRYPVFPINAEIFFTYGLFFGETVPQLLSCLSLFIILTGIVGYLEHSTESKIGSWMGVSLALSSPLLIFLSSVSYVDILLTAFITSGIFSLLLFFEKRNMTFLYLSGVSLGIAVGIKYTALIICVIAGVIFIFAIYLNKLKWRQMLVYVSLVSLIGLPWYIRTFIYTGNPVWPFMNSLFGYSDIWTIEDYNAQFNDFEVNGIPPILSNFIRIPIYLSSSQAGNLAIHPLIWFGVLIFILFMKKNKNYLLLLSFSLVYTISWFFSVNLLRYYALIIPTVILISGLGFNYFFNQFNDKKLKHTLYCLTFVLFSITPYYFIKEKINSDGPAPLNQEEYEMYLVNKLPTYKATNYATGMNGKTYGLLNENMYYYGKNKIIGDWFGLARYPAILERLDNEQMLFESLKKLNVDYLLINKLRLSKEEMKFINYKDRFKVLYEDESAVVYELK